MFNCAELYSTPDFAMFIRDKLIFVMLAIHLQPFVIFLQLLTEKNRFLYPR